MKRETDPTEGEEKKKRKKGSLKKFQLIPPVEGFGQPKKASRLAIHLPMTRVALSDRSVDHFVSSPDEIDFLS